MIEEPAGTPAPEEPHNINNHLVKAILVTIFCCLPLGIVSIVYAASVNGKLQAGDISGAAEASRKANLWANISLGIGIAVAVIYGIAGLFSGFGEWGAF